MTDLTPAERRLVLADMADLVNADRAHGGRVWTDRAVTAFLTTWTPLQADMAKAVFDEYCRERHVCGSAAASYQDIEAAEKSSVRLLDRLLGATEQAVA